MTQGTINMAFLLEYGELYNKTYMKIILKLQQINVGTNNHQRCPGTKKSADTDTDTNTKKTDFVRYPIPAGTDTFTRWKRSLPVPDTDTGTEYFFLH